jgi:hypothetical protein
MTDRTLEHLKERFVVVAMEDVLEVCKRPCDATRPVVRMDESGKQRIGEVTPHSHGGGHPVLKDDEYVRNGVADIFMAVEPLLASARSRSRNGAPAWTGRVSSAIPRQTVCERGAGRSGHGQSQHAFDGIAV